MTASMTSEANPPHQRVVIVSETGEGPFSSRITIGDHRPSADEPVSAGGLNTGPDPYEYLLAVDKITAFLGSLTGEQPKVTVPILPPSVTATPRPEP
jgi:hypothetical protein